MEFDILCIFLPNGKTFTFHRGKIETDNESHLVFKYKAMSDRWAKVGKFQQSKICGWSVTEWKGD